MNNILQAWNIKTVQEYLNICQHLRNEGKTEEDVRKYITNIQTGKKENIPFTMYTEKPCSQDKCSGIMELFTVCCSDIKKKEEGYFTKWECKECGFVEYDKRKLEEIRSELNA